MEPIETGSYTITIDASGPWTTDCPISYDFEVTIDDSLFILYPNPSSGDIHIQLHDLHPKTEIQIINHLGEHLVSKEYLNTDKISTRINGTSGIYFVKIITDKGLSQTIKVIKH